MIKTQFHTNFENMSRLDISIAYFSAEAHNTHFANFVGNFKSVEKRISYEHLSKGR